jgi:hypothetical protein
MRDDIHKRVPAPPKFQFWVRCAVRPADWARSWDAMNDAILDTANRELSRPFLHKIQDRLTGGVQDLFRPLGSVSDPREIGGKGTPLECSVLDTAKRLLSEKAEPGSILSQAIGDALVEPLGAHTRAADVVLRGSHDAQALAGIGQMQADCARVEIDKLAHAVLSESGPARPSRHKLSPDEDLLAPTSPRPPKDRDDG